MTERVLRPYGERAVLIELPALDDVIRLARALRRSAPPGVIDIVPAARTILVTADTDLLPLASLRTWVADTPAAHDDAVVPPRTVTIPVTYDGEDLVALADELAVAPADLVRAHTEAAWSVAFTGFAPGFGYLVSDDWLFQAPRRSAPRARVPAGSVGLAGEFSGVYPRSSPGGWQLIGHTRIALFTPTAASPVLLKTADRVDFRQTDPARDIAADIVTAPDPASVPSGVAAVAIVEPGALALVQDRGRWGQLADGISRSGAFDTAAAALANRLAGNDESEPTIEVTLGGFRAIARADLWVAVTGTDADITIGGHAADPFTACRWPAGEELAIAPYRHGLRACVAVRGGFDVTRVLGSAAADTLSGIGPTPLQAGTTLRVGRASRPVPPLDIHPWGAPAPSLDLRILPGPRQDWLTPTALETLTTAEWSVSSVTDRVGVRLDGPVLEWAHSGELPSEGILPGAIQVPPSGSPIIFGPDAPATGGYPVVAVVGGADLSLLAQARPGTRVRLRMG